MQRPAATTPVSEPRASGPVGGGRGPATNALIGRDRERAAISETLTAGHAGQAALLLVGDAGIGKTALSSYAEEGATQAGYLVLRAAGGEVERGLPHTALGDLFGRDVDGLTDVLPAGQRETLAAIRGRDAGGTALEARTVALTTLGLLEELGRERPLALVLDDIHWLDAASTRALTFALRRIDVEGVVIIATQRATRSLPLDLRSVWPDRRLTTLELGPLSPDELAGLLAARLGRLPRVPVLERVIELSAGHPLLALELAQLAGNEEQRLENPDPGRLSGQAARIIEQRLADLSRERATDLATVALMSEPTDEDLAALGVGPEALHWARDAGLLTEAAGRWAFAHPLIRSAAASRLTTTERRAIHTRLAQRTADPVARASHVARSVVGHDPVAAAIVEAGAREADRRGAPVEGAVLAERAVALTEPTATSERFERSLLAGIIQRSAGDARASRRLLEAAAAEAPAGDQLARALLELARLESRTGDPDAMMHLRSALRVARTHALRAEIHMELAGHLLQTAGLRVAARHARAATKHAEQTGNMGLLARCLGTAEYIAFNAGGHLNEAMIDRILEIERSLGPLNAPGRDHDSTVSVAHTLTWAGALDRARRLLTEMLPSDELGRLVEVDATWYLAVVDLWAGQWDAADRRLSAMERVAEAQGRTQTLILVLATVLAAQRGDPETPVLARRAMLAAEPEHLKGYTQTVDGALGVWRLGRGEAEAAVSNLERGVASLLRLGLTVPDAIVFIPDAIEALVQVGRPEDARSLADDIGGRTRRWEARMFRAGMARATAVLALTEGKPDRAAKLLTTWLESDKLADLPFLRARAELVMGQILRRQRHRTEARAMLERARGRFAALGAVSWTERAEDALARLGDRSGSVFGLTPTEHQIAELVAAGKTNREVAEVLVISVKTVEWNLTRVYEKVGVRSRVELAARYSDDTPDATLAHPSRPTGS